MKIIYYIILSLILIPTASFSRDRERGGNIDNVDKLLTVDDGYSEGEGEENSEDEVVQDDSSSDETPPDENAQVDPGSLSDEVEGYWSGGSIMYSEEKVDWVRKAVKSYKERIPLYTLLPTMFSKRKQPTIRQPIDVGTDSVGGTIIQAPEVVRPTEAPAFYLSSILYLAPDNWSVWINGDKVSFGEDYEQLEIVKVTENNVTMVWRDSMVDMIYPAWRGEFMPMTDERFMSNDRNIVVDLESGDVSFMLGVNQSLDSSTMQVVEGVAYTKDIVAAVAPQNGEFGLDELGGMNEIDNAMNELEGIAENILPKEVKKNDNPTGNKINPDLKLTEEYIKQLETLRSMLGK